MCIVTRKGDETCAYSTWFTFYPTYYSCMKHKDVATAPYIRCIVHCGYVSDLHHTSNVFVTL